MDGSPSETVIVRRDQGVLTLTMNRPDSLNALNVEMLEALLGALEAAALDDSVRVVVLTGAGRAFSAGQDLAELKDPNQGISVSEHLRHRYTPLILGLADFPKPTVARINGVAAGAGAGLALACDLKVMAEGARFLLAFSHLGLVLDSGTSYFLVQALGRTRALELALLGTPMDAAEAGTVGLVNRVTSVETLDEVVGAWAERLAVGSASSLRAIKRLIRAAEQAPLADMLELERTYQTAAVQSADHQRALTAFLEKKPSPFVPHP